MKRLKTCVYIFPPCFLVLRSQKTRCPVSNTLVGGKRNGKDEIRKKKKEESTKYERNGNNTDVSQELRED